MNIRSCSWLVPFCGFLIGYGMAFLLCAVKQVEVPLLVGSTVDQALAMVTECNLVMRLLRYKEETEVPVGTILSQMPLAYQKAKPHQSVFVVVATRPQESTVPDMRGQSDEVIKKELASRGLTEQFCVVPLHYPAKHCIAQIPAPGDVLSASNIICYIADTIDERVLWPNCVGKRVQDVQEFFQLHGIETEILHNVSVRAHHTCDDCLVVNQHPVPGSIITLGQHAQSLRVQLLVE